LEGGAWAKERKKKEEALLEFRELDEKETEDALARRGASRVVRVIKQKISDVEKKRGKTEDSRSS